MGLVLWVGIWDLTDYHIIPTITITVTNSDLGVCQHAVDEAWEPGLREILNHPGCAVTKALLIVVGALGLYVTRSLYGASPAASAMFQRLT